MTTEHQEILFRILRNLTKLTIGLVFTCKALGWPWWWGLWAALYVAVSAVFVAAMGDWWEKGGMRR